MGDKLFVSNYKQSNCYLGFENLSIHSDNRVDNSIHRSLILPHKLY